MATQMTIHSLPPYAAFLSEVFGHDRVERALAAIRSPSEVMTAEAMRLVKASPLSFTHSLIARMLDEAWSIERLHCEIDAQGAGLIVYRISARGQVMTWAARSPGLAPVERVGRILDDAMDFYSVLFDGSPDFDRIRAETDEQIRRVWKGRSDNSILGWSFSNRSNRLFDYAIESLQAGRQPDLHRLGEGGGYLIRNAGFYGNGRHGSRSWMSLPPEHLVSYPYHVDLICLYMWRQAGFDLVEAIARARGAAGAALGEDVKRYIGVGNSSGIGTVAALVRWPHWASGFGFAREFALAMAVSEPGPLDPASLDRLDMLLGRAGLYYLENTAGIDPAVEDRARISADLALARQALRAWRREGSAGPSQPGGAPMAGFMAGLEPRISPGAREQIVALLIEARPDIVGPIRKVIPAAMASRRDVAPEMRLHELKDLLERAYGWALAIDFSQPGARHYFWYRSEENGENRRGERAVDPGVEFETLVDVAGPMQDLHRRIGGLPGDWTVARYLVEHPDDVYFVARAQLMADRPYGECHTNLIDISYRASDLIQYYLAVLGMETTNPGNFRWVRGVFLQGAPLPEDIRRGTNRDWVLPTIPQHRAVESERSVEGAAR